MLKNSILKRVREENVQKFIFPLSTQKKKNKEGPKEQMSVTIYVEGKVQGVFYRNHTEKEASSLGLVGTVRNLDDGRVHIIAYGPKPQLEKLEKWCHKGSPKAKVTKVEAAYSSDKPPANVKKFVVDRG